MPTTVFITLDTAAPVIEWGEQSSGWPGSTVRVPYASDEPIAWAWLGLPDGRQVVATVLADRIEVAIPYDAPAGAAVLHVFDDLGNETTHEVAIEGAPPPEFPPTPVGGLPEARRTRVAPTRHRWDTRVALRSAFRVHRHEIIESRSAVWIGTRYSVRRADPAPDPPSPRPPAPRPEPPAPPPPQRLTTVSGIRITSTFKTTNPWGVQTTSGIALRSSFKVEADDSGEVAFLVALGVI